MAIRQIQSTFTFGELDPRLYSKSDFAGYFKGARKLRNVQTIPQGGVKRRFGTRYSFKVQDSDDITDITDSDQVNAVIFDFSSSKQFLIVARPHDQTGTPACALDIYLNDVYQTRVTTTDYTGDQIGELYFLRIQDRILILHEDVAPKYLVRGAADNSWTLATFIIRYNPTYDFSQIDGDDYTANNFTLGATTGTNVLLTNNSSSFNDGHVNGLFQGDGGVARIVSITSRDQVRVDIIDDFPSTTVKGENGILSGDAWGDFTGGTYPPNGNYGDRGWPSKGALFRNRLVLANSDVLPHILWASGPDLFSNFDDSKSSDEYSFSLGVGSDGNEEIEDIIGGSALVVIGFSGIYATPLLLDVPFAPSTAYITKQSSSGGSAVRAEEMDDQIFYLDENQQRIRSAKYDINLGSFSIQEASLLSPQLIDNPNTLATLRPTNNDGTLLMATNEDGTLALFQSLEKQDVIAWSLATTLGDYKKAWASRSLGYLLVRRSLGTDTTSAGAIQKVFTANSSFDGFVDISSSISDAGSDVPVFENDGDYILLGHEAPFYRVAVTLNTNASADLEPTFEYLDKTGNWVTLSVTDGTSGFTGDGTIVWDLDDDSPDWRPLDIEETTGIRFPITNPITGDKHKFWMRMRRDATGPIDVAFIVDPSFMTFTNITPSLTDTSVDTTLFSQDNEYLLIGHSKSYEILNVALETVSSANITPTFEYLDSTGTWQTFAPTDNTTGFTVAGSITWTASTLTNWAAMEVNGTEDKFWIRIRRTENTVVTPPVEDTIYLKVVTTPLEDQMLINTKDVLYIEKLECDEYQDALGSGSSSAAGLVTGLAHLQGQQVYARVEDVPEGPFYVNDSGEITVSKESIEVDVGLNYIPEVTPMPLVADFAFGQSVYQPKHLKSIYVDYYESLGITVNGQEIPTLRLNEFTLDQRPRPDSGVFQITPMRGWDPRAENVISQELPLPFTIIGIGYRLEVS